LDIPRAMGMTVRMCIIVYYNRKLPSLSSAVPLYF
jgi:hypothetical protein